MRRERCWREREPRTPAGKARELRMAGGARTLVGLETEKFLIARVSAEKFQ